MKKNLNRGMQDSHSTGMKGPIPFLLPQIGNLEGAGRRIADVRLEFHSSWYLLEEMDLRINRIADVTLEPHSSYFQFGGTNFVEGKKAAYLFSGQFRPHLPDNLNFG